MSLLQVDVKAFDFPILQLVSVTEWNKCIIQCSLIIFDTVKKEKQHCHGVYDHTYIKGCGQHRPAFGSARSKTKSQLQFSNETTAIF